MEGTNEMQLNQATMMKAVEHYFNQQVFLSGAQINVISVSQVESEGTQGLKYRIIFEPKPKPDAKRNES